MDRARHIARTAGQQGIVGGAALSAVAIGMLAARVLYTQDPILSFFSWNLVLAWIPFVLSLAGAHAIRRLGSRAWAIAAAALLVVLWLPFFPNAPYLVTDLIHIKERDGAPLWFDASMMGSFALAGVSLAVHSLGHLHDIVERLLGRVSAWAFVAGVCGLTGLGVYIGRFLRWNSWDLVVRPVPLAMDLAGRALDPASHPRTWAVTAVFAALLLAAYLAHRAARAVAQPA